MRIYMQTPPGGDPPWPRFYHIIVQRDLLGGWTMVREWGHQGSGGRVVKDHFEELDEAVEALGKARDSQLKRGYRIVFSEGIMQTG